MSGTVTNQQLDPLPTTVVDFADSNTRRLVASDAESGDFFGHGVAFSGDTVVVGAQTEDAGGSNAGRGQNDTLVEPCGSPALARKLNDRSASCSLKEGE